MWKSDNIHTVKLNEISYNISFSWEIKSLDRYSTRCQTSFSFTLDLIAYVSMNRVAIWEFEKTHLVLVIWILIAANFAAIFGAVFHFDFVRTIEAIVPTPCLFPWIIVFNKACYCFIWQLWIIGVNFCHYRCVTFSGIISAENRLIWNTHHLANSMKAFSVELKRLLE